ncbi:DUF2023 family protein [Halocella sp. SP3-1]|uniref:DUF2023 family protein n=1 Tax=Halocella sp. SP3-1 TaxID=2382161 RepID=UPI000F7541E7|nr:DUF2023 family protein [Halocella sp. SP3-1]AZO95986.1 DUF2023 family protein [Halocella sp. SP3-1]
MRVFYHHLYEFKKGLRNLILHTTKSSNQELIERNLKKKNIPYIIYNVSRDKINVFFGNKHCIEVIKQIGKSNLKNYTDEEDFILGIMLGYDRVEQCKRYMKRKIDTGAVDELVG